MRAAVSALAVVIGTGLAAAGRWVEPDPASIVGRWTGTARWHRCAAVGPARVAIPIARDGGGYRIDLTDALDGLGAELLAPVGARELEATRADLHVHWRVGKPNRASLRIVFDSGCEGTLTLTRDASGVAPCDELTALRAIAGSCPDAGVTASTLAIPPRAPRGKALAALTDTCRRAAAPLRQGLVEAGCVPAPVDMTAAKTRVPECAALITTVDRLMRCNRVPVETKQRLRISIGQVDRWGSVDPADPDARRRSAESCAELRDELERTIALLGCLP